MVAELAIPYFIPGYSKMEIKCSYADCKDQPKDGFRSDADMIQHKERNASGHHYYCSVCDVDCRDWDDEVKHRVASPNHIACGTCGANLQSKSGLDRHVKQVSSFHLLMIPAILTLAVSQGRSNVHLQGMRREVPRCRSIDTAS